MKKYKPRPGNTKFTLKDIRHIILLELLEKLEKIPNFILNIIKKCLFLN